MRLSKRSRTWLLLAVALAAFLSLIFLRDRRFMELARHYLEQKPCPSLAAMTNSTLPTHVPMYILHARPFAHETIQAIKSWAEFSPRLMCVNKGPSSAGRCAIALNVTDKEVRLKLPCGTRATLLEPGLSVAGCWFEPV